MENQEPLKILILHLKHLRNEEHFQFMSDTQEILEADFESRVGNLSTNINTLFSDFKKLLDREDASVAYLRKSGLTGPIAEADAHRETVYRGLVLSVESFLHSPESAQRESAQRIKVLIHNYGNLRRKSYNEETAIIHNLLQDLQDKHAKEVETIHLEMWTDALLRANETFKTLIKDRYDENPGRENAREVRREIDSVYRQMTSLIEIENRVSGGTQHSNLIAEINELVSYYKNTLAQRKGRADA